MPVYEIEKAPRLTESQLKEVDILDGLNLKENCEYTNKKDETRFVLRVFYPDGCISKVKTTVLKVHPAQGYPIKWHTAASTLPNAKILYSKQNVKGVDLQAATSPEEFKKWLDGKPAKIKVPEARNELTADGQAMLDQAMAEKDELEKKKKKDEHVKTLSGSDKE